VVVFPCLTSRVYIDVCARSTHQLPQLSPSRREPEEIRRELLRELSRSAPLPQSHSRQASTLRSGDAATVLPSHLGPGGAGSFLPARPRPSLRPSHGRARSEPGGSLPKSGRGGGALRPALLHRPTSLQAAPAFCHARSSSVWVGSGRGEIGLPRETSHNQSPCLAARLLDREDTAGEE
jgi:hypothetical protein